MPNNTFIFLRHAETKVIRNIKISKWILTENGKKEALNFSKLGLLGDLDIIISSNEEKAYQTAYPISERLNKGITRDENLNEINRDLGRFLDEDRYLQNMKLCLENRNHSYNKWEPANKALERFSKRAQQIDSNYSNKKILIVAHGGVINLYFAKLLEKLDSVYERALTNTFCDYGIIQNGKVIKDIAKN
jgi:broad specificity phosphatase PhoE